jgi:ketosteroid isomerase-like protein
VGATRAATRLSFQRWLLGALGVGALIVVVAQSRAQPAPASEDALVLSVDESLSDALRAGDKSVVRKLLSLQFSFVDENGKVFERKEFLGGLKDVAAAPASDATVKIYGRVAMVTGHRKSGHGGDVFFLDIWAKQKGAWRALMAQDVVLAASGAPTATATVPGADATAYECKNPCQTIPYRVRSPAEQDIVNSFQAIEKAVVGHDADEWSKHIADEFVLYGSGRTPIPKSERIAAIKRRKESNATVRVGEIETMRLSVYEDGAAMIATHSLPDNSRPQYHAACILVKRNGQWLTAISVQTDVKGP